MKFVICVINVDNLQVPFFSQSGRRICRFRLCSDKVVHCNLLHSDECRHVTDGHWHDWDPTNPPLMYMELAGPNQTFERPDQWIHPAEYKYPLTSVCLPDLAQSLFR